MYVGWGQGQEMRTSDAYSEKNTRATRGGIVVIDGNKMHMKTSELLFRTSKDSRRLYQ